AINSKHSELAPNETILIIKPINLLCQSPLFNDLANDSSECLQCYCFGHTDICYSSSIKSESITLDDQMKLTVCSIGRTWTGDYVDVSDRFPPNQQAIQLDPITREHSIDSTIASVHTPDSVYFYWRLPEPFLGNHLLSYGGHLHYLVRYRQPFTPSPLDDLPDVIIRGRNRTMYHYRKYSHSTNNIIDDGDNNGGHRRSVRFWIGEWQSNEPNNYNSSSFMIGDLNRQQILQIISDIQDILIKASYDAIILQSSILDIELESGQITDNYEHLDRKRSAYIEQCSCPPGYQGSSCEKCSPGYHRRQQQQSLNIIETNQLSLIEDKCIPMIIQCDCNGNSNECDPYTGQCLHCQNHTHGFHCEQCERGYYHHHHSSSTNPGNCIKCPCESLIACHPVGSIRSNITDLYNGQFQQEEIFQHNHHCQCKRLVTGTLCDKCHDGSFHLNDYSHTGCIQCFCFGVTDVCNGATNLYRHHISANIDRYSHGFILRDREQQEQSSSSSSESLTFDHLNREIIFQNFSQTSGHLYWQLPFNFLGNRITSYGGHLNYTFRFQGNYFQRGHDGHRKPFAIIMGNNQSLEYYHQQPLHPLIATTISIALFENQWYRNDNGQPASRRDLMITLANLDSILLLATVTNDISWIGLIAVTLDTSVELQMLSPTTMSSSLSRSISISTLKVDTIELCRCPQGYSGTSCERCAPGFKMQLMMNQADIRDDEMDNNNNNLFHRCVPCFCNGHSFDCDSLTGHCMNCQHHTIGPFCDLCEPGYVGNATHGTPDDCHPNIIGSNHHYHHHHHHEHHGDENSRSLVDDNSCQCNRNGTKNSECHPSSSIMNCDCKLNVIGDNCDQCRDGHFNLAANNPYGCSACYCFGVTDQCQSSRSRRSTIWMDFSHNYFADSKLELATRFQTVRYTDRISYNFSTNEAHFYSLFWLHENPLEPDSNPETLYWFLPRHFLGNRLSSYGGRLRFTRRYHVQNSGQFINDADVFLLGNGLMLQYISSAEFPANLDQRFEIGLQAEDEIWQKIDHQTQATGMATRIDFLNVLVNVEMIAIRATFHTQMKQSFLANVGLDVAVESLGDEINDKRPFAHEVEQCDCPEGYQGLSCEQCSPNYIREIDLMINHDQQQHPKCVRCRCHQHSDRCDPITGHCIDCQHNTAGDHCDQCSVGYYGDATLGTTDDCRRCPCPSESMANNFSPTCKLDIDGLPTCTQCMKNYTGRNCEICNIGYQRNESLANSRCES
ncbi:hypothetical protein BLA29_000718, partial [Euroglyphus maynei]